MSAADPMQAGHLATEAELVKAFLRNSQPRELSDAEILMRMAAVVALSGNPHTRLYLLRNRTELRRLPVRLWWFNDGLYVVRARTDHRDLLGCRPGVPRAGRVCSVPHTIFPHG